MALRYSQIINNQESLYFRVEIHDEDFVGTSSDFYLEDIEWDYKGQNNQRWQSVWASQLTIALQSTPTKDLTTLIDDILNADEAQFTVKVYKSTDGINYSFYWIGVILTDLSGGLDEAPVQSFQLVATDGLGTLKDIDYNIDDDTPHIDGTVQEHLFNVLKKIPTNSHFANSDVFLVSDIPYFETNMPSVVGSSIDWIQIQGRTFYSFEKNGNYKWMNCFEVLESICLILKARIFFIEGRWYLLNVRIWETSATANLHKFTFDGTLGGTTESYNLRQTLAGDNTGVRLATQSFDFFPPLKMLRQSYKHDTSGDLMEGTVLTTTNGLQNDVAVVSKTSDNATLMFKGVCNVQVSQSFPYSNFQVFVKLRMTVKIAAYYLRRYANNASQNNDFSNAVWILTTPNYVEFWAVMNVNTFGATNVAIAFQSPAIPTSGGLDMQLEVEAIQDLNGNDISANYSAYAEFRGTYMEYVDDIPERERVYFATNNVSSSFSVIEELDDAFFGDKITDMTPNNLRVWNGTDWINSTSKWGRNTLSGTDPLLLLGIKDMMAAQTQTIRKRSGTFHGNFDLHKVLVFEGDYWLPLGVRFSVIGCAYDGEWYDAGNYDDSGVAVGTVIGTGIGDEPVIPPTSTAPAIAGTPNAPTNTVFGYGKIELLDTTTNSRKVVMDANTFNYLINQLVIGSDTSDSSALVSLNSTTQGFLLPRMTQAQMDAISSPTPGLMVYVTDQAAVYYYNGTTWHKP